ncbi:MAG: peptidyl-prolyl cis-trans isomerase CWC27 [Olpidium bornovanus]|uniref:Peptidyl-prolyl cis-trans isomerase CWC27 n=1 Tax=Olpidium bornovanus TaxID=278681 RepID=A0A8H8DI44_9FUNG|nr:MAG: peptidyl-prolyl cis-trans isomerase CWC27 [Olpidium bornovanus]
MSSIYIQEPPTKVRSFFPAAIRAHFRIPGSDGRRPALRRVVVKRDAKGVSELRAIVHASRATTTTLFSTVSLRDLLFREAIRRLRFVRRGLVGMASTGSHTNRSQFFITLDRADELTKANTLFARSRRSFSFDNSHHVGVQVAGDTVYNVLKAGELELDGERPIYPPRIISTEVAYNPFDDVIPRITAAEKLVAEQAARRRVQDASKKKAKEKKCARKNVGLLSFGDEAEALEAAESKSKMKIKSSHELLEDDPTLSCELPGNADKAREKTGALKEDKRSNEDAYVRVCFNVAFAVRTDLTGHPDKSAGRQGNAKISRALGP